MAPVYGKDGFSDCAMLCNPSYGYSQSCKDQCEGIYNFTTIPAQDHSSTEKTAPNISLNPLVQETSTSSPSVDSPHLTHDSTSSPDSDNDSFWVHFLIGVIVTFIIILLMFCFRKQLFKLKVNILQRMRNRLCPNHPKAVKQSDATLEATGNKIIEESESLLEEINADHPKGEKYHENAGKAIICSFEENADSTNNDQKRAKGFRDSNGDEVENREAGSISLSDTDIGPIHYNDGEFQVINHDSYNESNIDSSGDDYQTNVKTKTNGTVVSAHFANKSSINGNVSTFTEDCLTGNVDEKGIIRVITEIKLR